MADPREIAELIHKHTCRCVTCAEAIEEVEQAIRMTIEATQGDLMCMECYRSWGTEECHHNPISIGKLVVKYRDVAEICNQLRQKLEKKA
jgi:hypothetical protein